MVVNLDIKFVNGLKGIYGEWIVNKDIECDVLRHISDSL